MVDRYGPRTCAVIGCFVTSVAITSCYFAKSTTFLIISYGGVAGTQQPLYNTVRYNTVFDITRFKDGAQKCIDYIEK